MAKSLQTLSRIQKFKIDEQRKILVEFQNKEEQLQIRLNNLISEYENEKKISTEIGIQADFGAYTKRYLKTKEELENQLLAIRNKIEEIRDIISDMFKEQKTFEIINQHRQEQELKELADKEQKTLDEIGTNAYIKNHK
ncbi:MAG: flagellar FliJ family protein [Alphaproteobacteria bacterium]|nr:flagellar FliJ family protein [Alphaproteobacteria bacterium]